MSRRYQKNKAVEKIIEGITQRLRNKRIYLYHSKPEMARSLGVSKNIYTNFEDNGHISLRNLLIITIKMDETKMFEYLFNRGAQKKKNLLLDQEEEE